MIAARKARGNRDAPWIRKNTASGNNAQRHEEAPVQPGSTAVCCDRGYPVRYRRRSPGSRGRFRDPSPGPARRGGRIFGLRRCLTSSSGAPRGSVTEQPGRTRRCPRGGGHQYSGFGDERDNAFVAGCRAARSALILPWVVSLHEDGGGKTAPSAGGRRCACAGVRVIGDGGSGWGVACASNG